MQNSDKLIKGKSPLARVVGDFAYVKNNEMLFLDYGPGSRQCCAFSRLLP